MCKTTYPQNGLKTLRAQKRMHNTQHRDYRSYMTKYNCVIYTLCTFEAMCEILWPWHSTLRYHHNADLDEWVCSDSMKFHSTWSLQSRDFPSKRLCLKHHATFFWAYFGLCPFSATVTTRIIFGFAMVCHCYWEGEQPKGYSSQSSLPRCKISCCFFALKPTRLPFPRWKMVRKSAWNKATSSVKVLVEDKGI